MRPAPSRTSYRGRKVVAALGTTVLSVALFTLSSGPSSFAQPAKLVGAEKIAYMGELFNDADLETMNYVRCAFDPERSFNPGKVFPTPRLCGDVPGAYRPHESEIDGTAGRG